MVYAVSNMTDPSTSAMPLAWFDLGDPGRSYVRSYLESNQAFGKRFGRLVIDNVPIADSGVGVFAPNDHQLKRLIEFERGGVFPARAPDWEQKAGGRLRQLLAPDGDHATGLWMEDALAQPADGWIARRPDGEIMVFCGDSVIQYVDANSDPGRMLKLCSGATWNPNVALIASAPPPLSPPPNRGAVDPQHIEALAAATTAIIIGVWDGEGLLFCEPRLAG
jgi:hypothetical protein